MWNLVKSFWLNIDGNASIDWIVLTAGLVTLGLTVGIAISTPVDTVASNIGTAMQTIEPATP